MEKHIVLLSNGIYFFVNAEGSKDYDKNIAVYNGFVNFKTIALVQSVAEFEKNNPDFFNK